jgi:hypothetical protein
MNFMSASAADLLRSGQGARRCELDRGVGQRRVGGHGGVRRHRACRTRGSARLVGRITERPIMNKTLIALLAATVATLSLGAHADTMTPSQADAEKTQAKGDYKADKAQAKADFNQNRTECRQTTSGSVERACKHDAKAQEKQDKADAKLQYKQEKADIKADTK